MSSSKQEIQIQTPSVRAENAFNKLEKLVNDLKDFSIQQEKDKEGNVIDEYLAFPQGYNTLVGQRIELENQKKSGSLSEEALAKNIEEIAQINQKIAEFGKTEAAQKALAEYTKAFIDSFMEIQAREKKSTSPEAESVNETNVSIQSPPLKPEEPKGWKASSSKMELQGFYKFFNNETKVKSLCEQHKLNIQKFTDETPKRWVLSSKDKPDETITFKGNVAIASPPTDANLQRLVDVYMEPAKAAGMKEFTTTGTDEVKAKLQQIAAQKFIKDPEMQDAKIDGKSIQEILKQSKDSTLSIKVEDPKTDNDLNKTTSNGLVK